MGANWLCIREKSIRKFQREGAFCTIQFSAKGEAAGGILYTFLLCNKGRRGGNVALVGTRVLVCCFSSPEQHNPFLSERQVGPLFEPHAHKPRPNLRKS